MSIEKKISTLEDNLSQSGTISSTSGMLEEIVRFIGGSSGLKVTSNSSVVEIYQVVDKRTLAINLQELELVLLREDQDGRPFLQINLRNNRKILLTDQLVGFKPRQTTGLDLKKLPRVVTTPDLVSVLEAVEEAMGSADVIHAEAEMLKRAYFAIVSGAENVGFKMTAEREWVTRLMASAKFKAA